MQAVADRFRLAQVGGQDRNAVLVQRHRRRGGSDADKRYRRDTGQPLKLQADHRVLADRRAVVDHRKRDNLARVVELQRLDLSNLNAVEVHAAALAQPAGGTLENDTKRSLLPDAVDLLEREKAGERRGNDRQRRGSDHEVARPRLHPKFRLRCTLRRQPFAASRLYVESKTGESSMLWARRACCLPMTQCFAKAREGPSSMLDPNGHTRLEACQLA